MKTENLGKYKSYKSSSNNLTVNWSFKMEICLGWLHLYRYYKITKSIKFPVVYHNCGICINW